MKSIYPIYNTCNLKFWLAVAASMLGIQNMGEIDKILFNGVGDNTLDIQMWLFVPNLWQFHSTH